MEEIKKILEEILNIDLIGATLSNPRKKEEIVKVKSTSCTDKGCTFLSM